MKVLQTLDIENLALFSIFHHFVNDKFEVFQYDTPNLYKSSLRINESDAGIEDIASCIYNEVVRHLDGFTDSQVSITLTGGMDSRVVLACLLKAGVKPNCLVYGHHKSIDAAVAQKIADTFELKFHNAVQDPPTKEWYYHWVVETIKRDGGNSHLHRAHRTAAISEHTQLFYPKILFTGHMGGEGLRGLTYNNYFSSPFFESVNEGIEEISANAQRVLFDYFHKTGSINFPDLLSKIMTLSWMKHDRTLNKLFFLYDLVGKIHHAQDIRLYRSYIPKVIPVFLQQRYLETLFSSSHHFMCKPAGILGRLSNPYIYSKIIESIYPPLLDLSLSNGYTLREYLKGYLYYVPVKIIRSYKQRKNHPPSFSYDVWYVDFVKEHAENISRELWEIYDKKRYMEDLYTNNHGTDEGYWHKFSNPIFFDLVDKFVPHFNRKEPG
jgi:hypothetical protein